jgi:hypothetical protein
LNEPARNIAEELEATLASFLTLALDPTTNGNFEPAKDKGTHVLVVTAVVDVTSVVTEAVVDVTSVVVTKAVLDVT